jgi:predicted N-acetyltransferase YhbS
VEAAEITVRVISEPDVTFDQHRAIARLREEAFPDFAPERSYFKQLPHLRVLAAMGDTNVGHAGLDYRVMAVGDSPVRVLGLIDICVRSEQRSRGIGGRVVEAALAFGREREIPFALLVADDPRLYEKHGFRSRTNTCTWLRIDEHQSFGETLKEDLGRTLMVCELGSEPWPDGILNWLGYMY